MMQFQEAPIIKETSNHSIANSIADKQKEKESKTIEQQQDNDVKTDIEINDPIEMKNKENSEMGRDVSIDTRVTILESIDDISKGKLVNEFMYIPILNH